MKEVKLSDWDYTCIFDEAHNNWISKDIIGEHSSTRMIVQSFIAFAARNDLIVKDGKIYRLDNEKEE